MASWRPEAAMFIPQLGPRWGPKVVRMVGLNVVRAKGRSDTVTACWGQFGGGYGGCRCD